MADRELGNAFGMLSKPEIDPDEQQANALSHHGFDGGLQLAFVGGGADSYSIGDPRNTAGGIPRSAREELIVTIALRSCSSSNCARRRADFTVPGGTHTGHVQIEAFWLLRGFERQPSFCGTWRTATISVGFMRRGTITS